MTTLTTTELTSMRDAVEGLLPDTCDIIERSVTTDETGGWGETDGTTHEDIPCRVTPVDPRGRVGKEIATRLLDEPLWKITVPWDQALSVQDRVIHSGKTYEVIWVADLGSERLYRWAYMRRV